MRIPVAIFFVCAACSSGSTSPGGAPDASTDAAAPGPDASDGGCFPFCSSSSSGGSSSGGDDGGGDDASGDAGGCDALKAKVESLLPPARACNPTAPEQCTGQTDGICCPVTISAGNESAVNDLAVAVADYKTQCTPSCIGIVCPPTPSDTCQPLQGTTGICK